MVYLNHQKVGFIKACKQNGNRNSSQSVKAIVLLKLVNKMGKGTHHSQ